MTVKDKEGRAIEGLTAKDFAITEDGEPQQIAFVEFQRLAPIAPVAPDAPSRTLTHPSHPTHLAAPVAPVQAQILRRLRQATSAIAIGGCIILYFDMTAMGGADSMRAFAAAQKFLETQMDPSVLMAVMAFQGGAVRVKTDFTDDRAKLDEVLLRLIYGDDLDGDGFPDNPGTRHGVRPGRCRVQYFQYRSAVVGAADRDVDAAAAARAEVAGVFLERAEAERHRQSRAAARDDERGAAGERVDSRGRRARPRGDAAARRCVAGRHPAACRCSPARARSVSPAAFSARRTRCTRLSKDTGGNAMFDYNDLSLGIVRAAESLTSYYIIGYYSTHTAPDGKFRRVRVSLTNGMTADIGFARRLFRRQDVREVLGGRQGTAARRSADAGEPGHRHHHRDGGELLPAQSRRVFRAGRREDSRQRARARAARRRGAHGDRFHRRGEGRLRHHDSERARQARHAPERRHREPAREAADPVRDRLHAAAGEVRHQDSRARRRDGAHRDVPDELHDPEPEPRGEAHSDQLGRPQQPARGDVRRDLQRAAEDCRQTR